MKICNRCGRVCDDNALFCECGNRFEQFNEIHFDRASLKKDAKTFYGINSGKCIGTSAIVFGITAVLSALYSVFGTAFQNADGILYGVLSIPVIILYAAMLLFSALSAYALIAWYRSAIYVPKTVNDFFTELFNNVGAKLSSYFLSLLKVLLWSLLFYIPGMIKYYEYSMSPYIVSENPNIGAKRSLEVSGLMTSGYKWDLFVLDLSFFGWAILSAFTLNILGIVYVFPYYMATKAFTYEYLKTKAINSGKVNPMEFNIYTNY